MKGYSDSNDDETSTQDLKKKEEGVDRFFRDECYFNILI
jgi:hypothetical protein